MRAAACAPLLCRQLLPGCIACEWLLLRDALPLGGVPLLAGTSAEWAVLRYPENLTISNMLYFLAVPTLTYQVCVHSVCLFLEVLTATEAPAGMQLSIAAASVRTAQLP